MAESHIQTAGTISEVRLVQLPEMKLVGLPVSVAFRGGDYSAIGQTKQRFVERMGEIRHAVRPGEYWTPWFKCDVLFTYFFCLEVSELSEHPEGMTGFTVPAASYAYVHYEGPRPCMPDPYGALAEFRLSIGLEKKQEGLILEKYEFAREDTSGETLAVEVFGPVAD